MYLLAKFQHRPYSRFIAKWSKSLFSLKSPHILKKLDLYAQQISLNYYTFLCQSNHYWQFYRHSFIKVPISLFLRLTLANHKRTAIQQLSGKRRIYTRKILHIHISRILLLSLMSWFNEVHVFKCRAYCLYSAYEVEFFTWSYNLLWLQLSHTEAATGFLKAGCLNHKHMWSKEALALFAHMSWISHSVFP